MLETAPSLSIYTHNTSDGNEEDSSSLIKSLKIGDKNEGEILGNGDFSFTKPNMDLIKEEGDELGESKLGSEVVEPPPSPPMYLAAGLGIQNGFDSFREDRENDEDYYRELLEEFPNSSLVLKNYAQFLQRKGDLQGAEEYYLRATKADPSDGEILSQYAILVWELHRDQERASAYFELAAQTAPKDSNVLAAYAKFLWEVGDEEDGESIHFDNGQEGLQKSIHLHPTEGSVVGVDGGNDGPIIEAGALVNSADVEDYYKRMIEKDPSDPLFLKKYAQFLYQPLPTTPRPEKLLQSTHTSQIQSATNMWRQTKGDLQGAEEYYSRAILAYPEDGEMLSQYATLLWELHHDQKRTLSYMERAAEASPGDSTILAAYACFLWTINDDEN